MNIHPSAIVEVGANIADSAIIGPYCVIGKDVEIKGNVVLKSHVCIDGKTIVDENTQIFPFACIGQIPQDLKYRGEQSEIYIGKRNVIREYVTIHPGTSGGSMKTIIGDDCLIMISAHIAHDCVVGNNVIMANNTVLGGHVTVQDNVRFGGMSAVHQFVRIGTHAIIGGGSMVAEDVIPFGSTMGERASLAGLNIIGMKRHNFDKQTIHSIRKAFKELFSDENYSFEKRINDVREEYQDDEHVMKIVEFLTKDSTRTICMPKAKVVS